MNLTNDVSFNLVPGRFTDIKGTFKHTKDVHYAASVSAPAVQLNVKKAGKKRYS